MSKASNIKRLERSHDRVGTLLSGFLCGDGPQGTNAKACMDKLEDVLFLIEGVKGTMKKAAAIHLRSQKEVEALVSGIHQFMLAGMRTSGDPKDLEYLLQKNPEHEVKIEENKDDLARPKISKDFAIANKTNLYNTSNALKGMLHNTLNYDMSAIQVLLNDHNDRSQAMYEEIGKIMQLLLPWKEKWMQTSPYA